MECPFCYSKNLKDEEECLDCGCTFSKYQANKKRIVGGFYKYTVRSEDEERWKHKND